MTAKIYGDGVSLKALESISEKLSAPIAEGDVAQTRALSLDKEMLAGQILVVADLTDERLSSSESLTPKMVIEGGGDTETFGLFPPLVRSEGIVISLMTKTAYRIDLPGFISRLLAASGYVAKDQEAVPLVLQEVIANALLHGNMGIHSIDRSSLEGLTKMQAAVDAGLADPKIATKRVVVKFQTEGHDLLFSVRDQGTWLDLKKQEENVYGRGSAIIREYTSSYFIDKETSTVSLCFKNSTDEVTTKQATKKNVESVHNAEDSHVLSFRDEKTLDPSMETDVHGLEILVVDDLPFNRQMIGAILKSSGFHNLSFAVDGRDAVEQIEKKPPDLLILDVMMPNMDGYEVCRHLRKQDAYKHMPIIVQTALESSVDRNEAFLAGATDVVTKPINAVELTSRVMIHLENRVLVRALKTYQARLQEEFAAAIKIQEGIFPSPAQVVDIEEKYHVEIAALFKPSSELTGDMWGFLHDDEGRLGIFVADFSGHGVSAAVNTFRLESLLKGLPEKTTPSQVLGAVTNRLTPLMLPGSYATMCYGVVDPLQELFIYAAAGSTNPLIHLPTGEVLVGDAAGIPLGIMQEAQYDLRTLPCPKGSTIFLYSDALTDNVCGEDVCDLTPLTDKISKTTSPKELVKTLLHTVTESDLKVDDDLTLFAVKV